MNSNLISDYNVWEVYTIFECFSPADENGIVRFHNFLKNWGLKMNFNCG